MMKSGWWTCDTPHCGTGVRFFCVRCRHYYECCRCTPEYDIVCGDDKGWAAVGERGERAAAVIRVKLPMEDER